MTSPQHSPEPPHEPAASQISQPAAEFKTTSDSKTDAGSIGLIILVILAVIASLVMLISGSANALKIALLASLWAAVLGFFLVVRYRRQAQEAKELLAVERAHAASALTASGASTADNSEVLAEIRSELEAIRSQIEEISGREWVYEPAALYAEARRIQELERKAGSAGVDERGDANSVNFTQKSGGAPTADAVAGRLGTQPTHPVSNPLDNLIAEKPVAKPTSTPKARPAEQPTGQQQPQRSQQQPQRSQEQGTRPAPFGEPRSSQGQAPAFRPMGEPRREDQPAQPTQTPQPTRSAQAPKPAQSAQSVKRAADGPSTETTTQQQPEFKTDSFQAVQWNQGAAGAQHVKEDAGSAQPHHRHRKPEAGSAQQAARAEDTRGRRRSDEHREGAVSVAELMARSKRGKEQRNKDDKK
ncbi:DUF4229 domain-containing protein [Corynebacterium sp. HMSC078H07]|uniref:DUF4229 domain-containing protein n=1 Tax=Corynebacterium sp. HMSC078H07 TaxID=1739379 RepID=UPI0008A418C1|nr:DUF4229 domain-containing protein [Corynebacterium sp. HMSC078H07]OFR69147.1 zinc metalloprotease [Corynebacterium sp. HMSC078H07]